MLTAFRQHRTRRQFVRVQFQHFVQMNEIGFQRGDFFRLPIPIQQRGGELLGRGIGLQQLGHGIFV